MTGPGAYECSCSTGWDPATDCGTCASGYQNNNGDGTCELDCATANPDCNEANGWGSCSDASGTAQCVCELGYTGAACNQCAAGYHWEISVCVPDVPPLTCWEITEVSTPNPNLVSGVVDDFWYKVRNCSANPQALANQGFAVTLTNGLAWDNLAFWQDGFDITTPGEPTRVARASVVNASLIKLSFASDRVIDASAEVEFKVELEILDSDPLPSGAVLTVSLYMNEPDPPTMDGDTAYVYRPSGVDVLHTTDDALSGVNGPHSIATPRQAGHSTYQMSLNSGLVVTYGNDDYVVFTATGGPVAWTKTAP